MTDLLDDILQEIISDYKSNVDTRLRDVVYIAGLYAGDINKNTREACEVGYIATKKGLASFVPHPCILMNVYGKDEIPKERQNGIVSTLSMISHLAATENSHLWVIQNENNTFSSGTETEIVIWRKVKDKLGLPENIVIKKFSEWVECNDEQ